MKVLALLVLALSSLWAAAQPALRVTVEWDPNTEPHLAGYNVYTGTNSGSYQRTIDVRRSTYAVVDNLEAGVTYYFAVTAYSDTGLESELSNEVSWRAEPPPEMPVEFSVFHLAGQTNTLTANWRRSADSNVIAYMVYYGGLTGGWTRQERTTNTTHALTNVNLKLPALLAVAAISSAGGPSALARAAWNPIRPPLLRLRVTMDMVVEEQTGP